MGVSGMNALERIQNLLDDRSFVELGGYISARSTDYNLGARKVKGDGVISGYGQIDGRMVYVYSQDVRMLGGSVGEMHAKKIASLYEMAIKTGAPVIALLDCAGLRLQESFDALSAFGDIFRKQAMASGVIPQIAAIFGMCGGGSSLITGLSDFVFMKKEGTGLFVNSPNALPGNTVEKNDSSSSSFQAEKAGNVDFVCETEEEMTEGIRKLLSYLPSDWRAEDAAEDCKDDLNRIIPELNDRDYDARYLLSQIGDGRVFLETKAMYAGEVVTGFLRLNGETVGVAANQPVDGESLLSWKAARKAARFIRFCDAFSIPVLTVTSVTGFRADLHEERRLVDALSELTACLAQSTTAKVNLIAGDAFGTAAVVMNSKAVGADFVLAWPGARIGMMDAGQAVRIIYGNEILESPDKMDLIREKTEEYEELQDSALAAAKRGFVDDIIEPDASRKRLAAAFEMLYYKKEEPVKKKHSAI